MPLNNLDEENKSDTQKLNELQALFAPILSALSEDQRRALATIDKKLFSENKENEFQWEEKTENPKDNLINNLLRVELKHVDRNENPWFDDDICY